MKDKDGVSEAELEEWWDAFVRSRPAVTVPGMRDAFMAGARAGLESADKKLRADLVEVREVEPMDGRHVVIAPGRVLDRNTIAPPQRYSWHFLEGTPQEDETMALAKEKAAAIVAEGHDVVCRTELHSVRDWTSEVVKIVNGAP